MYETSDFFRQIKSAGSALPANALYLSQYARSDPSLLTPPTSSSSSSKSPTIVGPVYIDPSAQIDPTAKIGPNVSIGRNVVIGPGARVLESILLDGVVMDKSSIVAWSIVGGDCKICAWGRVEGEPEVEAADKPKAIGVTILGWCRLRYSLRFPMEYS